MKTNSKSKMIRLLVLALAGPALLAVFGGPAFAEAARPDAPRIAAETGGHGSPGGHERGTKYLFIDRRHLDRLDGVEQVFHQPVKERGPVVVPDRPWEYGRLNLWNAPVWSEKRALWRMWYYGGVEMLPLYAESSDGLKWDKPRLGLVEWKGTSDNNVINLGFQVHAPKQNRIVLVRDDREENAARRYKGLTRVNRVLIALVSADGLNWKPVNNNPIPSNDEYRLNYDALNHRFVATVKRTGDRGNHETEAGRGGRPLSEFGRRVGLSLSDDFVHWTEPELTLWGDEQDQRIGRQRIDEAIEDPDRRGPLFIDRDRYFTDIYNAPLFTYEDLYLGLPVMFNQSGPYAHSTGTSQDGILYPSLIASRDLRQWDRLSRQPFIPHSRLSDEGTWDHGMIQATPPVRHGDELWFYYTGTRFTHVKSELIEQAGLRRSADEPMGAIFLARLRVDGFASLHAGRRPGTVLTVPVKVTGPRLYVNVDAKAGELRTEIRDAGGRGALPGYALGDDPDRNDAVPVRENSTAVPVRWQEKKDVSELVGREVRLYFLLRNANLYSFWFGE